MSGIIGLVGSKSGLVNIDPNPCANGTLDNMTHNTSDHWPDINITSQSHHSIFSVQGGNSLQIIMPGLYLLSMHSNMPDTRDSSNGIVFLKFRHGTAADADAVGAFGMGGGLTGNNSNWPDVGQGFSGASAMVITVTNLRVGMGARVQDALQGGGSVQIKWSISKIGDV